MQNHRDFRVKWPNVRIATADECNVKIAGVSTLHGSYRTSCLNRIFENCYLCTVCVGQCCRTL